MKTQTLFAISLGTLLVAATGCKSPARFTNLGTGTTGSSGAAGPRTDLSTQPIAPISGATGEGVTGTTIEDLALGDEASLLGRDQDRSAFAAQTLYFAYDQSTVRADEATKIDQVAAAFKARGPGHDLLIEGHCDERGTEEYNRSLGERRALAIRELLIQAGVDSKRIFTRSFGKDKPVATSHDEAAYGQNRRGEFVLVLPKNLLTTQLRHEN